MEYVLSSGDRLLVAEHTLGRDPGQNDALNWFRGLGGGPWLQLRSNFTDTGVSGGTYSALVPLRLRQEALIRPGWALTHGTLRPGFVQTTGDDGDHVTTYGRLLSDPYEPIVVERTFDGIRPSYEELAEEFRLFHNLHAESGTEFVKFDESGHESLAARIESDSVMVSTQLVRQYQAAKQMDLLLFIDRVITFDPSETPPPSMSLIDEETHVVLNVGISGDRAFSRLLGKRALPAPPIERSGIWPYEVADDHFPEFIIGTNDDGTSRRFTCDPERLSNDFGANPEAPNYLTAVHFRRDVLVKYFDRPDLYTVEDGYLRCRSLWGLRMDNDTSDSVVVWLGDLGRDLPSSERDYWLSFNTPPTGGISQTAYHRAILGQFADAQSSDLRFRVAYSRVREGWTTTNGWALFRDPEPGDAHLLDSVRRPLHNTETEFEDLVRTLAILLIDSLNEAELVRELAPGPANERGIGKLQRWLEAHHYPRTERDIAFLRGLQRVRSEGTAHRKGAGYEATLDRVLGPKRKAAAGEELLNQAVQMLTDLSVHAGGG